MNELISEPYLNFTKNLAADGILTVHIDESCNSPKYIRALINKTDKLLDIDFKIVKTVEEADIYFTTFGSMIDKNTKGRAEPLVEQNQWKISVEKKKSKYTYLIYTHELGHTLGLEHPFDGQDGDYWNNTTTNDTVMSYNYVKGSHKKDWFFRQVDKDTLTGLWN